MECILHISQICFQTALQNKKQEHDPKTSVSSGHWSHSVHTANAQQHPIMCRHCRYVRQWQRTGRTRGRGVCARESPSCDSSNVSVSAMPTVDSASVGPICPGQGWPAPDSVKWDGPLVSNGGAWLRPCGSHSPAYGVCVCPVEASQSDTRLTHCSWTGWRCADQIWTVHMKIC